MPGGAQGPARLRRLRKLAPGSFGLAPPVLVASVERALRYRRVVRERVSHNALGGDPLRLPLECTLPASYKQALNGVHVNQDFPSTLAEEATTPAASQLWLVSPPSSKVPLREMMFFGLDGVSFVAYRRSRRELANASSNTSLTSESRRKGVLFFGRNVEES